MNKKCIFTIALADVPIRITCRHQENMDFLRDYLTDREPTFSIEPTQDDLDCIKQGLEQMAEQNGSQEQRYDESFLENNAIHALIAENLVAHNVLLFHGSALRMDGQAYIFAAPSGTGKSTHARLWREAFGNRVWMINDDKPLIRVEGGKATVYGSPWDGKHHLSRNASAPLKAIFWLCRGKENRLEPMEKADAYQMLLRQGYSSRNRDTERRIIALETELLSAARFYTMECNMEVEAALTAWKGVNET